MSSTIRPPTVSRDFAEQFLSSVDDPARHGVHLLFNEFWQYAPDEVRDAYVTGFLADDANRRFDAERRYADPITVERLTQCPPGSLGEALRSFVVDNGLEQNLATNYRSFHDALEASGTLDGMPEPLRYAVLRGFQLHDVLHVVTGYGPSPAGEIGLQAFCLAQTSFPYFAMWVAVTTTRMTFLDPAVITPLMDSITRGWAFGRTVENIQFESWELRLDEPLGALRAEYGIPVDGWCGVTTTV